MRRRIGVVALVAVATAAALTAQGKVKQYGRATVEYRSDQVAMVANYDYSQRNQDARWQVAGRHLHLVLNHDKAKADVPIILQ